MAQIKPNKKLKTITFCSGKGGVGKSVITANIAGSLSNLSRKIIVFDSVLDLPNQHIIFGVEPPIRLSSVLSGHVDINSALFQVRKNVELLVDSPFEIENNDETVLDMNDIVRDLQVRNDYEYLFIDTQSGITDQLVSFCYLSDLVVIMITDEPTSLLDAYGLVKVLVNYIDPKRIVLLVNNVIDSEDAAEVSQKLNLATEKFLKFRLNLIGFVPYSRNVRLSIQTQELLIDIFKQDESSIAINRIASEIDSMFIKNVKINNDYELTKA